MHDPNKIDFSSDVLVKTEYSRNAGTVRDFKKCILCRKPRFDENILLLSSIIATFATLHTDTLCFLYRK